MLEIMEYLRARYLGEKGQGLTEYAVLLAFVVVVVAAVTTNAKSGLIDAITAAFSKVKNGIDTMTISKS
ncbi:pilus assembly protein Flp/PilA [Selenomonas ruminantium]|uniref:Pilus assembly protein Flp/PilA n=1 Tax=Selenomonas ruminantium TaxID=971 RepID=A0A1M6U0K3_SELRU|nr:hypothetical protein [Selenomonas ruminantium]SHK62736.1 pilus assembly protein Flp/PilA [Selenomonas ruminantium]